jgi:hypothetical protein
MGRDVVSTLESKGKATREEKKGNVFVSFGECGNHEMTLERRN